MTSYSAKPFIRSPTQTTEHRFHLRLGPAWDNSPEAQQAAALVWREYLERRCWREWERDDQQSNRKGKRW